MIWVYTVCKGYQQTTLVDQELIVHTGPLFAQKGINHLWLKSGALQFWF